MIEFIGEPPKDFVTFASCDPVYLHHHAKAFLISCAVAGNDSHVHIIDPSEKDIQYANILRERILNMRFSDAKITFSFEVNHTWRDNNRVYYACNRFLTAHELFLRDTDVTDMFITDIDAMLMKHVSPPKEDIGLFLREPLPDTNKWESEGTRVAAGAVFVRNNAWIFLRDVADEIVYINSFEGGQWFTDQIALHRAYKRLSNLSNIHVYDNSFMDWEFVDGTTIWTGKGPRKYENPKYLAQKKKFEEMI